MCAHHHCSRCYLLQAAPDLFTLVCSVSWEILSTHVCLYVSRKAGFGTEPRTFSKWGICANHCSTMPLNTQENTGALPALQKHLYSCLTTIYASKSVSYEVNKCSMTNPNYWMSETCKFSDAINTCSNTIGKSQDSILVMAAGRCNFCLQPPDQHSIWSIHVPFHGTALACSLSFLKCFIFFL